MVAFIGMFLGMFGLIYSAIIGRTVGIILMLAGLALIVKQMQIDELEERCEMYELGYRRRDQHKGGRRDA